MATVAVDDASTCSWQSLYEVNETLGHCRVFLRRQPSSLDKEFDHRECSVRLGVGASASGPSSIEGSHPPTANEAGSNNQLLHVILEPATKQQAASRAVLPIAADAVDVKPDCLSCQYDHICLVLGLRPGVRWSSGVLAATPPAIKSKASSARMDVDAEEEDLHDLLCRACRRLLLSAAGKTCLQLPTGLWQECAEVYACEECLPLGGGHIRAKSGQVFVSPQCYLVSAGDLRGIDVAGGTDGLVRCPCGAVIGETAITQTTKMPATKQVAQRRATRKQFNDSNKFCTEGWRRGASLCQGVGVNLYKHRLSMPRPSSLRTSRSDNQDTTLDDVLHPYTEEAAVGAQLLALRANGGPARFVLLPGRPTYSGSGYFTEPVPPPLPFSFASPQSAILEPVALMGAESWALEIRIVVGELIVVGPFLHTDDTSAPRLQHGGDTNVPRRMAKVYYRRRPCELTAPSCHLVGVPAASLEAVHIALDHWASTIPPSQAQAPISTKASECSGGEIVGAHEIGPWRTSLLLLPPRDAAFE